MMNRGRVIQGRVEYRVDYQILGEFLSKKSQVFTLIYSNIWVLVEYLFDYDP